MFLLLTLSMYSFAELIIVFLFCEREYFQNTFKNFICSVFCGCFTNKVELTKFWQFFERNHLQKIAWKYLRSVCCGKRYRQKSFSTRKLILYVSFRKTCGIKNQWLLWLFQAFPLLLWSKTLGEIPTQRQQLYVFLPLPLALVKNKHLRSSEVLVKPVGILLQRIWK